MKKIVFFNYYHNGDVHVSRGLIRQIMDKVHQIDSDIEFAYAHRNNQILLADIPKLSFDNKGLDIVSDDHSNLKTINDTTYINTWYGQQNHKYMNMYGGINIDCIYAALDDSCKTLWNFSLQDISKDLSTFFPIIDYSKYQIENACHWINCHPETKIIVENGPALSGQAHNFDMTSIIVNLAKKHPDKLFILTAMVNGINLPNVFFSHQIINSNNQNDLNEVSYLSSHCNMIIGRASGVFSFTLTQENLFQRQIKYLCFSNLVPSQPNKFWLGDIFRDKVNYKSSILTTNESNINNVEAIIEENL